MIEKLLKTLSEELQVECPSQKDAQQFYSLSLNPELQIKMKELDLGMVFFSTIGPYPVGVKKEELFSYLMKANFLGQGTGGASMALSEDENSLTLSSVIPYDMNYKHFRDTIEDFVNYIDYWKAELIRLKKAAEESKD